MKAIIAGGRNFTLVEMHYQWLDVLHRKYGFTEIIHGDQRGVDRCSEIWAVKNGILVKRFPANWDELGAVAGPTRNAQMARYAGPNSVCILFPGGKGTDNMRKTAKRFMMEIEEWKAAA